jgi:hypothetical protein
MSAPFLTGASSPRDPFQGARAPAATPILALARQWDDLTRQIDDGAAYRQAERAAPPFGGDEMVATLWERRNEIERQASALEPSLAGIAFKLRAMLWSMNVELAECANGDGVRTNELTDDEKIIASALADADKIAAGTAAGRSYSNRKED